MKKRGWVYIISNPSMVGLIKIGFSTKDPKGRANELSGTGTPHPYVVEYDALVTAPREVEQKVHDGLEAQREGKELTPGAFEKRAKGLMTQGQKSADLLPSRFRATSGVKLPRSFSKPSQTGKIK